MTARIRAEDPLAPPTILKRLASRVAMSDLGLRGASWYLRHVVSRVEPVLSEWTGGRLTSLPISPIVFLERPGKSRATPLTYFTDGDDVVLIASNFGRRSNPTWYREVMARPEVTLRARGQRFRCVARETTGPERERLWSLAQRWSPALARYQAMAAGRAIPLLRCSAKEAT